MHSKFAAALTAAKSSSSASSSISKCFMKAKSDFLMYADYCSNLLSAQDLLDSLCEHNPTVDIKIKVSDLLMFSIIYCVSLLLPYYCLLPEELF